jgi:hypothetical protein
MAGEPRVERHGVDRRPRTHVEHDLDQSAANVGHWIDAAALHGQRVTQGRTGLRRRLPLDVVAVHTPRGAGEQVVALRERVDREVDSAGGDERGTRGAEHAQAGVVEPRGRIRLAKTFSIESAVVQHTNGDLHFLRRGVDLGAERDPCWSHIRGIARRHTAEVTDESVRRPGALYGAARLRAHVRIPLHVRLHEDVVEERQLEIPVELDVLAGCAHQRVLVEIDDGGSRQVVRIETVTAEVEVLEHQHRVGKPARAGCLGCG